MSAFFDQAIAQWRSCRAEFELWREAAYERAETECNGNLLNRRGLEAGIHAYSLFIGPEVRALAYASEELLDHWGTYSRPVYADYERTWIDPRQL